MKKVLSILLSAAMITALLSACGAQNQSEAGDGTSPAAEAKNADDSPVHTLYFRDSAKSKKAVANFFNSGSGKSEDVEMKKVSEDSDSVTFSCEGDTSVYNMAYVICDGKEPDRPAFSQFAFNKCVSGWYQKDDLLIPYTQSTTSSFTSGSPRITTRPPATNIPRFIFSTERTCFFPTCMRRS